MKFEERKVRTECPKWDDKWTREMLFDYHEVLRVHLRFVIVNLKVRPINMLCSFF